MIISDFCVCNSVLECLIFYITNNYQLSSKIRSQLVTRKLMRWQEYSYTIVNLKSFLYKLHITCVIFVYSN